MPPSLYTQIALGVPAPVDEVTFKQLRAMSDMELEQALTAQEKEIWKQFWKNYRSSDHLKIVLFGAPIAVLCAQADYWNILAVFYAVGLIMMAYQLVVLTASTSEFVRDYKRYLRTAKHQIKSARNFEEYLLSASHSQGKGWWSRFVR